MSVLEKTLLQKMTDPDSFHIYHCQTHNEGDNTTNVLYLEAHMCSTSDLRRL